MFFILALCALPAKTAAARPEVTVIDRQKYVSELGKLLEVMSDSDREQILAMINACFDAGSSDAEVIERLGSPTKAAISVLRNYKPSQEAAKAPEAAAEPETAEAAVAAALTPDAASVEEPVPESAPETVPEPEPVDEESFPDIESMLESGGADVGKAPEEPVRPAPAAVPTVRAAKAPVKADAEPEAAVTAEEEPSGAKPKLLVLIPYAIGAVVIGVPVTILLILLSLAALAAGLFVGFAAVVVVSFCFLGLTAVADVLLVAGVGLMLTALCLPLLLLAVTIFTKCVIGFIDLILALGGRWCWTHGEE